MAFTYSGTLTTDLDKARYYVGDTDSAAPIFTDAEVEGAVALFGDVLSAAISLADAAAARFARRVNMSVDGASFSYSDMARQFRETAAALRRLQLDGPGGIGSPFVGGVSVGEMDSADQNTDRPASRFKVGMDDYPALGDPQANRTPP